MERYFRLASALSGLAYAHAGLALDVDGSGNYKIQFDGSPSWDVALSGSGYGVRSNGQFLSSNGGLRLAGAPSALNGADSFGAYSGYSLQWDAQSPGLLQTNFYVYEQPTFGAPGTTAIMFEQVFTFVAATRTLPPMPLRFLKYANMKMIVSCYLSPLAGFPQGAFRLQQQQQ